MRRGVLTVSVVGVACAGVAAARRERRDGLILGCRRHLRPAASSILHRQGSAVSVTLNVRSRMVAPGSGGGGFGSIVANLPAWHEPGRAPMDTAPMASCCRGHAVTARPKPDPFRACPTSLSRFRFDAFGAGVHDCVRMRASDACQTHGAPATSGALSSCKLEEQPMNVRPHELRWLMH